MNGSQGNTAQEPDVEIVFDTLRKYKSMPMLEIAAVTGVPDKRVQTIVDGLAQERKVRVTHPESDSDAIVTMMSGSLSPP